jgi:GNAT superfamily N-acetyltransferase
VVAVEFREAALDELGRCTEVIRQSFQTVADDNGITRENLAHFSAFIPDDDLAAWRERGQRQYVAVTSGEIAGFLAFQPREAGEWHLQRLAVLPSHRHLGIARRFLAFAADQVREWGATRLTLGLFDFNDRLQRYYAGLGWHSVQTFDVPGIPYTVTVMEYPLH